MTNGEPRKLLLAEMSRNLREGPACSAIHILRTIDRHRYVPVPVFSIEEKERVELEERAGLKAELVRMDRPTFRLKGAELLGFVRNSWAAAAAISKIIREKHIDLVHINSVVNLHAARAAIRSRTPYVLYVREMMPERRLNRYYVRWVCGHAVSVVAVSNAVKSKLASLGVAEEKIHVLYNGVEIMETPADELRSLKESLGIPPSAPTVGMVGTVTKLKGQIMLVRAMPELLKRFPELRAILVGDVIPDGIAENYKRKLLEAIDKLGVGDRVVLTGARADARKLMAMFDALAQPSVLSDSLPRSVLEAMAAGTPVVGSRIGGIPEMVTDGETGFVVEPGKPEELAKAIGRILESRELKESMGRAARARAEADFNSARQMEKLMEIYDAALGGV